MLWEYVYIGSEMIRNSMAGLCLMIGLCLTTSTKESRGNTNHPLAEPVQEVRRNRQTKTGLPKKKDKRKPSTDLEEAKGLGILLALEPRIMFDGAALVTGAEVVQDQVTQEQPTTDQDLQGIDDDPFTNSSALLSALSSVTTPSDRKEIVFIDTSVEGYQTLLEGIDPNAEAVLLDSARDGMEQIAEILRERSDIDAIHIISHGNQGELRLGTGVLNLASMQGDYADELTIINQALTEEADFLIYGCNFGEGELGQDAASLLAELTGADIAASNDLTGSTELGGDWDLEYATGHIETQLAVSQPAQEAFAGLLATVTVDTTADENDGDTSSIAALLATPGGTGISLREAIIATNNTAGADQINLAAGTHTLTRFGVEEFAALGDFDIRDDLTIAGASATTTIIDGAVLSRIFDVHNASAITVNISDLKIQNSNSGGANGAALHVHGDGVTIPDVTLTNVWLTGNDATGILSGDNGGAVYNQGMLTITDSLIENNRGFNGGGIYNDANGNLTLTDVTLSGNNATSGTGGGLHNTGTATLTNVTISGNTATSDGGGIWNDSSITVTNSTITGNSGFGGGGIYNSSGTVGISNTIVSDNLANNAHQDVRGTFNSDGFNLVEDITGSSGFGSDITGVSANLGVLADNGGPTPTHALQAGSLALNAGTTVGAPATDQRGVTRDAMPDIGAFEVTPPTLDLDGNNSSGATGNDYTFPFTEGDGPTGIADGDTDLVAGGSSTFASVKLSISGLLDGNAETLVLDASTFALATAVPSQNTMGGLYHVVIGTGAGTATVTITKQGGGTFTEIETETLITAIQYQHTDTSAPTNGDRLIDFTVNDGIVDSATSRTTINVNPTNDDPVITSDGGGATAMVNAPENQTSVTTVTVTDVDLPADTLTFSKIGGADAALFNIDSGTGALTFSGARDFETFTDANSDGVYEVTVQVDDGNLGIDTQAISVTVTDVLEGNTLVVDTTDDYGILDARYGDTSSIGALLADKGSDNFISLREAIEAANNTANGGTADEIHFNIADTDSGHLYYQDDLTGGSLSSVATTTVSDAMIGDFDPDYPYAQHSWFRIDLDNALPQLDITDALIINGYTQAGATQNTLSVGDNAELRIELTSSGADGDNGLAVQAGGAGSSISGLVINGFDVAGIMTEPGADNVTVQGNFIGTDVTGTLDLGNNDAGVHLRSSDNQVGGSNVADRNVISGNQGGGVTTFTFGPIETGNVIQNNYIGADATGIGALGNSGTAGVQIYNQDGLQLLNNVIGDNANRGVRLLNSDSIVNTVIQGNLIGVGADGTTALGHTGHGILISEEAVNTTIGGILASQGNTIANNGADGIIIAKGTGASIRGNRIFNNVELGIDLLGIDGVNNNDAGDGDNGPNNLQNFPVLATANVSGTDLTVNGTLNSIASTTFDIDFYASITADGSGHGEAERYLGSASVTTDGSGNATISELLNGVGVVLGEFVTATATDSNGNTSEFSLNVSATPANTPPVAVADGFVVLEGSTNTLDLAGNDTDADDGLDLTSITIISGPTNGTIDSINTDGTVEYTHNGSETVADSFTYTIDDLSGATSSTVTVSLTITPQNDAPIIISDGGGASASLSILTGNTTVTTVNASDVEGTPLTYSIAGGADAALFSIDPTTGALTFNTAPDVQAPGDVGGDNVYDVIVRATDGVASDTQAIAITVTDLPVVVLPPPPDPPSDSDSPFEDEGDTGESEDEALGTVVNTSTSSQGSLSADSQGSSAKDPKDSNLTENQGENDLAAMQERAESEGMVSAVSDLLNLLQKRFDSATFQTEMQSLLSKSGFLKDLDRVRDTFQGVMDTEKVYLASSIAASSGLSIGYVIWLLRSGVLLTALLSSVPAWQFVNPLLILDAPTKTTHGKGQEDDSVETMFENHTVPDGASETQTEDMATTDTSPGTRQTSR